MFYQPSHGDKANMADRDSISGARIMDGEDQSKCFRPGCSENNHY